MQKLNLKNNTILREVKSVFFEFLKTELWFHNFQSRFLTEDFSVLQVHDWDRISQLVLNKDILDKRLESISFIFTQDYLESNHIDVANKIFDDMGILRLKTDTTKTNDFRQASSKILYDSLHQNEIDIISSYFELDNEIYNRIRSREISNTDV